MILGIVLVVVGIVAMVATIWTFGIIVLLVGAALAIVGLGGRQVAGRKHWYRASRTFEPDHPK